MILALLLALLPAPAQHGHSVPDGAVYELAGGAQEVRVPLRFTGDKLQLSVLVDGKGPFDLTLDTGMPISGVLLYDGPRVRELGLEQGALHVQVGGAGGEGKPVEALSAEGVALGLGGLSVRDTRALVIPRPEGFGPFSDGVIGAALFAHFVVRIDLDARELTLSRPEGWKPREGVASVPLERAGGMVFAEIRVAVGEAEPVAARVVVDIGASHALSLDARADGTFAAPAGALELPLGRGVSGVVRGKAARVRRVELGGFAFDSVVTGFPEKAGVSRGGAGLRDGNLGEGILQHFNVTFDYAGGRMLLEKARGFDAPFDIEMTGLANDWQADGTLRVRSVLPDSPAATAGIRADDLLLSIDGKTPLELGETGLREALRGAGAERRFRLRRGADELEVRLKLRRLV